MNLIIGLITIILVIKILKLCGVKEDIGCLTILIIVFGLPIIAGLGETVINLLK